MADLALRPRAGERPAAILIVDDSAVARAVIGRALDGSDRYAVAGAVPDALAALSFLARHRVDVIMLDLELPGIDGLSALPDLIAAGRGARVLVVSSAAGDGAAASVQALALGAADTLVKPGIGTLANRFGAALRDKLERLIEADLVPAPHRPSAANGPGRPFELLAIGGSTGGIHALSQLLRHLPADFVPPILITQHLPESFMPYFAAQVAVLAGRPCTVAVDRERVRPGRVLIAPGDAHLNLVKLADGGAATRLSHDPAPSGCRPSVDPMLHAVAGVYGERALAVILSGMGRDGATGAAALVTAGGSVVVQDRETSTVWGMPGAAAPVAAAALSPDAIGRLVATGRRPA